MPNVHAASNDTINFQGKIVNKTDGTNLLSGTPSCIVSGTSNDTCDFRVSIYSDPTGGTLLWQEPHTDVEIGSYNGVFNLGLNSVCSDWIAPSGSCSGAGIDWGADSTIYMEIEFDDDGNGDFVSAETFARKLFNSVPFAYYADEAGSLSGSVVSDFLSSNTSDTYEGGSTNTLTVQSLLSAASRSNPLIQIVQANNATYDSTGNLMELFQQDTASTGTVLYINNLGSGNALEINSGGITALIVDENGNVGIGAAPTADKFYVYNTNNASAVTFVEQASTLTGEKDVFVIKDLDNGGGGQDESSVLKIWKAGSINDADDGVSLLELAYSNSNNDQDDEHFYVSGRLSEEGAMKWGVDLYDADIWTTGGLKAGATGTDCGGTDVACFNVPTFEVTSTGAIIGLSLNVSGTVTADGGDSTEWNTAYGWGNHADAGYLTSDQYTGTVTSVATGNGLSGGPITATGTISINAPTCTGTNKLQWSGTAFTCVADLDTNTTYTAGTGLSLSGTTFNNTDLGSSQSIFKNIAVSGQSNVVSDANSDTLTLVAGSNVTLATNATTDTITISATDTNTDTNNYLSGLSFNTTDGVLTATRSGLANLTVDLDGRYVTTSNDTVSGTELDGVFTTTGLLRRTAAGTYSTITDSSSNWNTAYGWGNHALAGYFDKSIDIIGSISDVTISSITSGEILKWNGSSWINNTLAEVGIQPAGSYLTSYTETDPQVGSNTTNYLSKWNGSALVTSAIYETGGNVGIGSSTATYALDVSGNVRSRSSNMQYYIYDTDTALNEWSITTESNENLGFWENATTSRLVLQAGGNVGIGDTTPNHKLDVAGNIGLDASGYINFGDVDGTTGYGFRDNAGSIEFSDSGGGWTALSDFSSGGGGITYTSVSTATTMSGNTGYITTNDSTQVVLILPATAIVGDTLEVTGEGDAGWVVKSNATVSSQQMWQGGYGSAVSSSSSIDFILSTSPRDAVKFVCAVGGNNQVWVEVYNNPVAPRVKAPLPIEYLVVAGGGGGAGWGGGGGGVLSDSEVFENGLYTVTVGSGGYGGTSQGQIGGNGGYTSISNIITATGGGGGGGGMGYDPTGLNGSSGGGGGLDGSGGIGIIGQGTNGGQGQSSVAGGGGGASVAATYQNGGNGVLSNITGTPTYYGGGGGGGGAGAESGDGATGGSGVVILRMLTTDYTDRVSITGSGSVTTDGSYSIIKYTGNGTITIADPGADLAEWTKAGSSTLDNSGKTTLEAGDLLCVDKTDSQKVVACNSPYASDMISVVTTTPGMILGEEAEGPDAVRVVLSGRAPVKVTESNGVIKAGDPVTSSDISGVGMRATHHGNIIGIAMEDFDPSETDRVMVFVNPSFYEGNLSLLSVDTYGNISTKGGFYKEIDQGNLVGQVILENSLEKLSLLDTVVYEYADGSKSYGFDIQKLQNAFPYAIKDEDGKISIDYTQLVVPIIDSVEGIKNILDIHESNIEGVIISQDTLNYRIDSQGLMLDELTVSTELSVLGLSTEIDGLNISLSKLGDRILSLESGESTYWSESAGKLTTSYALDVNDIYVNDGIFLSLTSDTLNIGGGALEVNNLGDVYIVGDIYGTNGTVKFVEGITVPGITTSALRVENITGAETIGTVTLLAGETQIIVPTSLISDTSKVFITLRADSLGKSIYVSDILDGESFTINISSAISADIIIDWIIIEDMSPTPTILP